MRYKKTQTLTMAENYPFLPLDLIISNILPLLPVKSIGRFRSVSKPWRSLLSSPQFIKSHLKLHVHDPETIIFTASSDEPPYIVTHGSGGGNDSVLSQVNLPLYKPDRCPKVEGSCNGLVLVSQGHCNFRQLLVNPITLEAMQIPDLYSSPHSFRRFAMCGFGYDSFHDDYKIVSLSDAGDNHCIFYKYTCRLVDVYSVKMKTWRRVVNSPFDHCLLESGVFVDGCIHWMACERKNEHDIPSVILAAFSLAREEFEKVSLPSSSLHLAFGSTQLAVLGGCLSMVVNSFASHDVWVMKEYGAQDSWIKVGSIDYDVDVGLGTMHQLLEVVCLLEKDEILLVKDTEQLAAYNFRTRVWTKMVISGIPDDFTKPVTFRGSLLSPNYK